jgi:hypothetical protein
VRRPTLRTEAFALVGAVGWLCLPGDRKRPYVKWNWTDLPAMPARHVLETWWRNAPGPQVVVVLATRSGIVVADVDPRHDGDIDELWRRDWPRDSVIELTPTGGWHIYAQCPPEGLRIDHKYAPGIELLGDGAVIACAPSMKVDGTRYTWVPGHSPFDVPVLPLPDAVLADIRSRRTSRPCRAAATKQGTSSGEGDSATDPAPNDPEEGLSPLTAGEMRGAQRRGRELVGLALERVRQGEARHPVGLWLAARLYALGLPRADIEHFALLYQQTVRWGHV